jgi:membrane protease YdiL (CAAX protease family)
MPMGIFLSIYWRRSGNLAVPGVTHAVSDSVRNVLVGVP